MAWDVDFFSPSTTFVKNMVAESRVNYVYLFRTIWALMQPENL